MFTNIDTNTKSTYRSLSAQRLSERIVFTHSTAESKSIHESCRVRDKRGRNRKWSRRGREEEVEIEGEYVRQ
jgi:hypothetical protein